MRIVQITGASLLVLMTCSQAANCLPYSLNPFKSATSHMSTRYSGYGF